MISYKNDKELNKPKLEGKQEEKDKKTKEEKAKEKERRRRVRKEKEKMTEGGDKAGAGDGAKERTPEVSEARPLGTGIT